MRQHKQHLLTIWLIATAIIPAAMADDFSTAVSSAWGRVREEGGRALVIGKIKAAYADRKDVPGRLIRVRFDGKTVQLAGFVPSREIGTAAEDIAREAAKPEDVVAFWSEDADIAAEGSYKTHVGEQTDDALLKAKVALALNSPAVAPQFRTAEILHVQVVRGAVTVYIVADEASEFSLDPHVKPIPGVISLAVRVVNAF